MRQAILFTTVGIASASQHKPVPYSVLSSKAIPPTYDFLAALGESYHNAWRHCVDRTVTWLNDDLEVQEDDPAFSNNYYVEYDIENKVPRVYEIFHILLGEENYWPAPTFDTTDDNFKVDFGYQGNHFAQSRAQIMDELPEPYEGNELQEWITEHWHPNPDSKTIGHYEGVAPEDLKTWSKSGRLLKELFYNIQQTSYYCDFTLESAKFALEKVYQTEKAEEVDEERDYTKSMWQYILRTQVAPMRWALKIWTRYNIAEPAVHKMIKHFHDDWTLSLNALATLPIDAISEKLEWTDYAERLDKYQKIKDQWVVDFDKWWGSCYDDRRPPDDVIKTSDEVCHDGILPEQITQGEKDAASMWLDFFKPMLEAYKETSEYDASTYDKAYKDLYESSYALGEPHSFRCEFIWIRTRVRYFELVPTWELKRIASDTMKYFQQAEDLRNDLVENWNIEPEGIYSKETLDEMKAMALAQQAFLNKWAVGDDEVFDEDGELHRKKLRNWTAENARNMKRIENWYFMLAFKQFSWAEDASARDFTWDNVNKDSAIAKHVRPHLSYKIRTGFKKWAWREMVKLNFHTWRRI